MANSWTVVTADGMHFPGLQDQEAALQKAYGMGYSWNQWNVLFYIIPPNETAPMDKVDPNSPVEAFEMTENRRNPIADSATTKPDPIIIEES